MSEAIYLGEGAIQPNNNIGAFVEEGFDPRLGRTKTYEWRGRSDLINAKAEAQIALGRRTAMRAPAFEGGQWILSVTIGGEESQPTEEPLTDKWLRDVNWIEKSMWEHPKIKAELDKLIEPSSNFEPDPSAPHGPHLYATILKNDIDKYVQGETETKDRFNTRFPYETTELTLYWIFKAVVGAPGGLEWPVFLRFIEARLKGTEVFPMDQIVLRREMVVAKNFNLEHFEENSGKMIPARDFHSVENVPDDPAIGELPQTGFWLKKKAKSEQTAPDKFTINIEYWHCDDFEPFLYEQV